VWKRKGIILYPFVQYTRNQIEFTQTLRDVVPSLDLILIVLKVPWKRGFVMFVMFVNKSFAKKPLFGGFKFYRAEFL
jgi:hypothetical protein